MAYLVSHRVRVFEGSGLVSDVTFNHACYLVGVNLDVRCAYAVAYVCDGYWLAQRRVKWLVDVVQMFCLGAVERVKLQDDVFGQTCHCRAYASCGCEVGAAFCFALVYVAHFKYGPVYLSHEAVAQFLCHLAQVYVVVGYLAGVDMAAEVTVCRVWCAVSYGLRVREVAVGALAGRCAGEEAYLKLASGLVFGLRYLGQLFGHGFGRTRRGKSAKAYILAVADHCGSLGRRHAFLCHN